MVSSAARLAKLDMFNSVSDLTSMKEQFSFIVTGLVPSVKIKLDE